MTKEELEKKLQEAADGIAAVAVGVTFGSGFLTYGLTQNSDIGAGVGILCGIAFYIWFAPKL